MRMRIRKIIPQGQVAYEVQRDMFFHGEVEGEGGSYPPTFISSFKIEVSSSKILLFKIEASSSI